MANRDVVAIGASSGGIEALLFLAKHFPANFPASVLVTVHLAREFNSSLDEILSRAGPLKVQFATDGQPLRKSCIYLAPPDRHLLLNGDYLQLGSGPRENNFRPAVDAMLRSTALCCGGRAIGVILTGTMGDGASGLWALHTCGGITVVQDPNDAKFSEMPETALARITPEHVVPLSEMPELLVRQVNQPAVETRVVPQTLKLEVDIARGGGFHMDKMDKLGHRSVLACPDCHGVMWEINEDLLTRYRCHVGHTYTAELMSVALDESVQAGLASASRALEERLTLARKLQKEASQRGQEGIATMWFQRAREYDREMRVLRDAIQKMGAVRAKAELASSD